VNKNKKFYELDVNSRLEQIGLESGLDAEELKALSGEAGLTLQAADHMIENVVGTYALPLGIARNFLVNGREVLVPMAVEEPSVVAAASYMAKLAAAGGGFQTSADPPEMIGQMQVLDLENLEMSEEAILAHKEDLLEKAGKVDPLLKKLGGGARDLEVRRITDSPIGPFLVLHLIMDVRDAMGANTINTALERLTDDVEQITGGRVLLRILSNLADRRLARASCAIPEDALAFGEYSGEEVRDRVIEAWAFAAVDPFRAATHNKGIMNGVDAVVLATGNDWRAVEAGAHAFAGRNGQYTSLSRWSKGPQGELVGELELPMAVGIIGGATRVHPGARAALKLMGISTASELAQVITAVGLAQNLGALRALATEGIQRGHMLLHARQVAAAAGAKTGDISRLAARLIQDGKIHIEHARQVLEEWKQS
jgi:hydroxymethylglutaryl-CoA reductase